MYTNRDLSVILDAKYKRIEALGNALRNMTANFRTSLLLVSDHETRTLGMDLVRAAEALLRSVDRGSK